jgi:Ethanolamine utilization protein EutJ (predicted chaperonin)
LAQIFSDVMTASSMNDGTAIIDRHDFSSYQKIVDVGGAHGALLALILDRHPEPAAVLFDGSEVIASGVSWRHVYVCG